MLLGQKNVLFFGRFAIVLLDRGSKGTQLGSSLVKHILVQIKAKLSSGQKKEKKSTSRRYSEFFC